MPGIEWIKTTEGGLELLCDCGSVTILAADPVTAITAPGDLETITVSPSGGEVAFTCPGCSTVHWLTLTPSPEGNH